MKRPICDILGLVLLVLTSSCYSLNENQNDLLKPRYEAKTWLEANPNPCAFAGNRFGSTYAALAFVELLYERGAVEVLVTGIYDEDWRIESEGGPYADTLIVRLPSDPSRREGLFDLANEEARKEGFVAEGDTGQEELLLWWD